MDRLWTLKAVIRLQWCSAFVRLTCKLTVGFTLFRFQGRLTLMHQWGFCGDTRTSYNQSNLIHSDSDRMEESDLTM